MAKQSVTTPTVEVPAAHVLANAETANEVSCIIESVIGILEVAAERFADDRFGSTAIYGAIRLAQDGFNKANSLQVDMDMQARAREAVGAAQ
ncbi:hypothetical protein [Aerolutibacter ruishenii]|uniref:Uncharacterized protein n=1 Tax=Aerolutibacter ruishenii TaxID=686800 RepID=A0A562LYW9_9GAMM|nr:hypothetical protein [Lysobacter ruishenii]TWI12718.1 hypothetical protein IP93_01063 [Lysobacter ruishenii]